MKTSVHFPGSTYRSLVLILVLLLLQSTTHVWAQEEGEEERENPEERARLRFLQRRDDNGRIEYNALIKAKQELDRMRNNGSPQDAGLWNWDWIGPGNIGGRIRAILIHPVFQNTMWIGGASGGIWRTDNGGSSWFPVADFMANLAITSIVVDPVNTSTLYASTGEAYNNADGLQGAGIFKSTDLGVTWNQLASTNNPNFQWVNRLAHHPTQSNILLAATANGNFSNSTGTLRRTTDGGITWTVVLNTPSRATDVKFHPLFPNTNALAGTADDAYFSSDGGVNWTQLTTGAPGKLPTGPGRCETAFSRSSAASMYVSFDRNGGEIWNGTVGAATWTLMNTGTNYLGTQGSYDNAIWVDPNDANTLVVGGIDLWRSTNGGTTLTRISKWQNFHNGGPANSAHADQHMIIHHPAYGVTNNTVYFGNDGGIQRAGNVLTVTETSGWTNLASNLGITQFFGGAAAPDGSIIVGGAQDNDKLHFTPGNGIQNWRQPTTGDGGFAAVDYITPSRVYGEYVNLSIQRSDDGGITYATKTNGLGDAGIGSQALFIAPFVMDPNTPTTLIAGGASLWRTTDAAENWTQLRPAAPDGQRCSAIDIAKLNSEIIWAGYESGRVSRSFTGGSTWLDVTAPELPPRYVTDIAINPETPSEVIITFGGYNNNSVWLTTNGGANWVQRTGTAPSALPSIQVNTVRYHPLNTNWVYVGTDLGVFASENKGMTWSVTPRFTGNEGPVNVEVDELFWQGTTVLVAATHGRGMFRTAPRTAIFVDNNNPNIGDGTPENPYRFLQFGIGVQGHGTTLLIHSGTYQEGNVIFNRRGLVLPYGGPIIIR